MIPTTLREARAFLREQVRAHGNQSQVALRLGTTRANLSRLLSDSGNARPSLKLAGKMQLLLGVPVAFWGLPDDPVAPPAEEVDEAAPEEMEAEATAPDISPADPAPPLTDERPPTLAEVVDETLDRFAPTALLGR